MKTRGHQYADDTALYFHGKPENVESLLSTTNQSIEKPETWASNNNFALNKEKTKLESKKKDGKNRSIKATGGNYKRKLKMGEAC